MRDFGVTFDQFLNCDDHITAICRSTYFHIRNIGKIRNLLSYNACSTIIHALISCRLDYCNSLLYNVPTHKTDRLQRLQNQCARLLTKSPRREHITPVIKSLHWLKIQDRITYKILMLTYKSYYNIAPTYLCELISRRESSVNTRLGADHHQLMPPIVKIVQTLFLSVHSCMPFHANGTNWVNVFERQLLIHSGRVLKQCYLHNNMGVEWK